MSEGASFSLYGLSSADDIEGLASRMGLNVERVLLEGVDLALESTDDRRRLVKELAYRNPVRGMRSEFKLFDDGYLSLRESGRRNMVRFFAFDARFIDARPFVRHRRRATLRRVALACAALWPMAAGAAYLGIYSDVSQPLLLVFSLLTPVAIGTYVYLRTERISFRTLHGRATVFWLEASLGSMTAGRRVAAALSDAIAEVQRRNPMRKPHRLRGEIQECYRLLRTGVLSAAACRAAVQQALAQFE